MDPLEELKIEYKRLARHANFLERRFSPAVARDLSVCLRNFVQLSEVIDALAAEHSWKFKFSKHIDTKKLKKSRSGSENISVPMPGIVQTKGLQMFGLEVTHYDHMPSDEELEVQVKAEFEASKEACPVQWAMSFDDWLNNEVHKFKRGGNSESIQRRTFIERGANWLGGAHAINSPDRDKYAHPADPAIVDLLSMQQGIMPVPYAVLMESAQEILRVFKPYLQTK